jgi:polysaccharide deacetylase family protein (PEP-CTERM system associated)
MVNILTIDVEEYFHPSEAQRRVSLKNWEALPSRVEAETDRVLDLLARHNARATFFVMGWVAERHPRMMRRIVEAGHEIGCHSYAHQLVYDLTPAEFRADTQRAVRAIEDAVEVRPRLYRAPSYSITIPAFIRSRTTVTGFPASSGGRLPSARRRGRFWRSPSPPLN